MEKEIKSKAIESNSTTTHKKEHTKSFSQHKHTKTEDDINSSYVILILAIAAFLIIFNQFQINSVSAMAVAGFDSGNSGVIQFSGTNGEKDLSNIDLSALQSTGHTLAAVMPVENIQTQDDAISILIPTGTPDYGAELGVSFDEPVDSLAILAKMYRGLKAEVEQNNPEGWQRFMNLASRPVGISCEFCCGIKAIGIDKNGNSACGCQHNPAVLSVALYLSAYSDYSDGEILREVMKWKTLFFPKDMVELGLSVAGGDTSSLSAKLPGMVGGC